MPKGKPRVSAVERVMQRVVVNEATGCWEFQGVSRRDGYGAVGVDGRGGPKVLAHRLMYEHHVGPVPEGFEVHHQCRNRSCCNPRHLVAISGEDHRHKHRHDRCSRGHDNWRVRSNGERECRTCHTDRERAKRIAKAEADRAQRPRRACDRCGADITGLRTDARFCGSTCRSAAHHG